MRIVPLTPRLSTDKVWLRRQRLKRISSWGCKSVPWEEDCQYFHFGKQWADSRLFLPAQWHKVSREEITNSRWKKIKDSFPDNKRFRSYPTIKIGRFAVALSYRGQSLGSDLMDKLKLLLKNEANRSAFRFITVDAYLSAIPFYTKNGFTELTKKDEDEHTRLMYFDMMEIE